MAWNKERRWENGARLDSCDVQDRILNTAAVCFLSYGMRGMSIGAVAMEMGLSPQALQGYYKNSEILLAAVLKRELNRLWSAMEATVKVAPTYCDWLVDAVLFAVDWGRTLPSTRLLFLPDVSEPLRNILLADRDYIFERADALAGKFEAIYRRRQPEEAPAPDRLKVVEWFHRQFLSYQTKSLFFEQNAIRTALLQSCPGHRSRA